MTPSRDGVQATATAPTAGVDHTATATNPAMTLRTLSVNLQ